LANPPATAGLDFSQRGHGQELWSWCDALFMAPPAWLRLYAATGDARYRDFAVTNFWRTTDFSTTRMKPVFPRQRLFQEDRSEREKDFLEPGQRLGARRHRPRAPIPADE